MPNKLTVIIPSRNDSNLKVCLEAIWKLDPKLSVIVVDDGLLEPPVQAIPGVKPFVFARNMNLGIRAAGDSDVGLLNDDAVLRDVSSERFGRPCGFSEMQRAYETDTDWLSSFGIVSAAVRGPSNSPEHAPVAYPRSKELAPETWDLQSIRRAKGNTVPFVCVFIPRTSIERVGLLDERFDCYGGDDDDYCYRVRKAGLKIGIFDGCVVDHGSLQSTFRPDGKGLPIQEAQRIFREIHGFEMATR